eukprot:15175534-Alexandrium_andersonii.AAC.1
MSGTCRCRSTLSGAARRCSACAALPRSARNCPKRARSWPNGTFWQRTFGGEAPPRARGRGREAA